MADRRQPALRRHSAGNKKPAEAGFLDHANILLADILSAALRAMVGHP